ncbi:hypothetical protein [uncultured Brevibacterium sp.]|uniref:hypothetical protein n=1 Tax=uncultured Brevibacterium sp. TaxID=189678 RepID=UPI0025CBFE17|nr:hypothetical protein [uncultured Brevibacterium sp.]
MKRRGPRLELGAGIWGGLAAVVVIAVLLPVAPQLGHRIQEDACSRFGACTTLEEMSLACSRPDRGAITGKARTTVYHAPVDDGRSQLSLFADGTATVVEVDGPHPVAAEASQGGPVAEVGPFEEYGFTSHVDARRWLVGRTPGDRAVADSSAGPANDTVGAGYFRMQEALGLGAMQNRPADAAVSAVSVPGATERSVIVSTRADGSYTTFAVAELPWQESPRITSMAAWMGITGMLTYAIEHDPRGVPVGLTLSGTARERWNMDVLRSQQVGSQSLAAADDVEPFAIRTYSLDLRTARNAEAFDAVFETVRHGAAEIRVLPRRQFDRLVVDGDYDRNPVDALADRIGADAVLVSARYAPGRAGSGSLSTAAMLSLVSGVPQRGVGELMLESAESMDLANPETEPESLVDCEIEETEEE